MCAILDSSVVHKVFGSSRPSAGKEFHHWINTGYGRLAVGGKLRRELAQTPAREWLRAAIGSGRVKQVNDGKIDQWALELRKSGACQSDDQHVIALAQLSGARWLYSEDGALRNDFKNRQLISSPRGSLYPEGDSKNARRNRKRLFAVKNLCREDG